MRKLETTNSLEQNNLNELINAFKKEILELKRRNHELDSEISDINAQAKMKNELLRQELNSAKEANALLQSRNDFLADWCKELEADLKKERISNVDILHDHTVSRR
jgi:predicted  nucleic acid-binding Zn-ribbon protein